MMPRLTKCPVCARVVPLLVLAALSCPVVAVSADDERTPAPGALQTIVVHGKRYPDSVPDEELGRQVQTAVHDDPFFYGEHVTITVTNGIVHLEGFVLDDGDMKDVLRLIKKRFPHVKRLVNELEVLREDSDDG